MAISEEDRKLVTQFQFFQQQLQSLVMQKENLKAQKTEFDHALEELGKTKEKTVYKIAGPILIKTPIADAKAEIEKTKENFDSKMTMMQQTEEKLTSKLKDMEPKIKEILEKSSKA